MSDGPLLSLEKLAVGGATTVRGYRENFLVRDNGLVLNLELPIRFNNESGYVLLTPFVDYGVSWDNEDTDTTSLIRNTDEKKSIASVGLSFGWQFHDLFLQLIYAHQATDNLKTGEDPRENVTKEGLQDKGVHFILSYRKRL